MIVTVGVPVPTMMDYNWIKPSALVIEFGINEVLEVSLTLLVLLVMAA